MKICKNGANSVCGKIHCCYECDEREDCNAMCTDTFEECGDMLESDTTLEALQNEQHVVIQSIADLSVKKKQIEEQEKALKSQLVKAMEQYGVKTFENDKVKFTYIAPSERTIIDSKTLKLEMPEIAEKYSKVSKVSATVKITVKEGK